MYAVVQTGGKQYRVTAGSVIEVEKLEGAQGATIALEDILAISNGTKTVLGSPKVVDAKVNAEILAQGRGEKVIVFKKKRRQNYRRKNGHRQFVTTLHITDISFKGESLASTAPKGVKAEKVVTAEVKEAKPAAAKKPAAKKAAPAKKPAAEKAAPAKKPAAKKPAAKKPAAKKAE